MQDLRNKVAVVTGAASGIGLALANRFAEEGMKVVLADVEVPALARAEAELRALGATVLAVPTDVSKADDVDALAEKTITAFGGVQIVCNNAGVAVIKASWEHSLADWEWVLGVNLWGVIHGVRTFVPILLGQGTESHIVNTASVAGLTTGMMMGSYHVSKHGVVALSEDLARELAEIGAPVKVSVLCPGLVRTKIMSSHRNRSMSQQNPETSEDIRPAAQMVEDSLRNGIESQGMPPEDIANLVVAAIRAEKFYILPHPDWKDAIRARMDDIVEERNPENRR